MAQTVISVQFAFDGQSPASFPASSDKRLFAYWLSQLAQACGHGSRYRPPGGSSPYIQYQTGVVQASGTITAATVVAGNTASIGGQALTATQRRATGTATAATVLAGTTLTLNGQVFTAVNGAVVLGAATFDCSGTDTATAASIAAQVNAYGGALVSGIVAARSAAAIVTFYAVEQGTGGNSIDLLSSDGATLAVSGSGALAGGTAIANNTFDFAGTNDTTAAALAAAINASTTAAVKQVTATSSAAVVTVTAKVGGLTGNGIAFTSSGATLTVSGAGTLTNGAADAPVRFVY